MGMVCVQGASGYVAVYEMLSGCRISRMDLKMTPVEMMFAPDGSSLVIAVQVRHCHGVVLP